MDPEEAFPLAYIKVLDNIQSVATSMVQTAFALSDFSTKEKNAMAHWHSAISHFLHDKTIWSRDLSVPIMKESDYLTLTITNRVIELVCTEAIRQKRKAQGKCHCQKACPTIKQM